MRLHHLQKCHVYVKKNNIKQKKKKKKNHKSMHTDLLYTACIKDGWKWNAPATAHIRGNHVASPDITTDRHIRTMDHQSLVGAADESAASHVSVRFR